VEQEIIIKDKHTSKTPRNWDLKDILLLIGFASLETGTAMFTHAGALILAGVLLMSPTVIFPYIKRGK
jgi:hypothetical protein